MTEICLRVADDGSMTISTEQPETAAEEMAEPQGTPVASKEEAIAAFTQMLDALLPPTAPPEEGAVDPNAMAPGAEEEAAMSQAFRPGTTGRM
jgi:hypothetical protein